MSQTLDIFIDVLETAGYTIAEDVEDDEHDGVIRRIYVRLDQSPGVHIAHRRDGYIDIACIIELDDVMVEAQRRMDDSTHESFVKGLYPNICPHPSIEVATGRDDEDNIGSVRARNFAFPIEDSDLSFTEKKEILSYVQSVENLAINAVRFIELRLSAMGCISYTSDEERDIPDTNVYQ